MHSNCFTSVRCGHCYCCHCYQAGLGLGWGRRGAQGAKCEETSLSEGAGADGHLGSKPPYVLCPTLLPFLALALLPGLLSSWLVGSHGWSELGPLDWGVWEQCSSSIEPTLLEQDQTNFGVSKAHLFCMTLTDACSVQVLIGLSRLREKHV